MTYSLLEALILYVPPSSHQPFVSPTALSKGKRMCLGIKRLERENETVLYLCLC